MGLLVCHNQLYRVKAVFVISDFSIVSVNDTKSTKEEWWRCWPRWYDWFFWHSEKNNIRNKKAYAFIQCQRRPCSWRWMLLHCAKLIIPATSVKEHPPQHNTHTHAHTGNSTVGLNSNNWLKVACLWLSIVPKPHDEKLLLRLVQQWCEITCCLGTNVTWCMRAGPHQKLFVSNINDY